MRSIQAIAVFLIVFCVTAAAAPDGGQLYTANCAECHESTDADSNAPHREAMGSMSAQDVLLSLEIGSMSFQGSSRTREEREAIATFVAGKPLPEPLPATVAAAPQQGACAVKQAGFPKPLTAPRWNGWGADLANTRFQPAAMAGLTVDQVPRLRLKWAFGLGITGIAYAQPTIVGGLLFVGSTDGKVRSLDAKSGCIRWEFLADTWVRTAITVAPGAGNDATAIYFGDGRGTIYALNAQTGAVLWRRRVEDHPAVRITGAPVLHEKILYVPVSSFEEVTAVKPSYGCCTFRGSVVALDAATGRQIWKTYTIASRPSPTGRNSAGVRIYGPAGAPVWSAPTIDVARKALYIATGNNYSNPATDTSDAVMALDLATGAIRWYVQTTPNDVWVLACLVADQTNCPESRGPDWDFGQSPILAPLADGRHVLVAGQKSGMVYGIDPDQKGKVLWQTRVGNGGVFGGIMWGSAVEKSRVYVANSDYMLLRAPDRLPDPSVGGGLFGLDLETGNIEMRIPPIACLTRNRCSPAQSAAVTAIPGVIFSGSMSGYLRAYSTNDSRLLWEVDTAIKYETVNGIEGQGGAMDGPGPVIVDGILYVNSGYELWGGIPGNVLLAFSVDGS